VVDEFPDNMRSPSALGGTPVTFHLYVAAERWSQRQEQS